MQDTFTAIQADRIDTKIQVYEEVVIDLDLIICNSIFHNESSDDNIKIYIDKLQNEITELKKCTQ